MIVCLTLLEDELLVVADLEADVAVGVLVRAPGVHVAALREAGAVAAAGHHLGHNLGQRGDLARHALVLLVDAAERVVVVAAPAPDRAVAVERERVHPAAADLADVLAVEQREVVLSAQEDEFFRTNMFVNFGELGENMKALVDEFGAKTKTTQDIQTIDDMKRVISAFPEFRAMGGAEPQPP